VISNGLVWAGDEDGRLVAHDAKDGRRLCTSTVLMTKTTGRASPVVAGAYVLIAPATAA
jgi:hypothetical protein